MGRNSKRWEVAFGSSYGTRAPSRKSARKMLRLERQLSGKDDVAERAIDLQSATHLPRAGNGWTILTPIGHSAKGDLQQQQAVTRIP